MGAIYDGVIMNFDERITDLECENSLLPMCTPQKVSILTTKNMSLCSCPLNTTSSILEA